MSDLRKYAAASKKKQRVKIPHKLRRFKLDRKKPMIVISERKYTAEELLGALEQHDPEVTRIVEGGLKKLQQLIGDDEK